MEIVSVETREYGGSEKGAIRAVFDWHPWRCPDGVKDGTICTVVVSEHTGMPPFPASKITRTWQMRSLAEGPPELWSLLEIRTLDGHVAPCPTKVLREVVFPCLGMDIALNDTYDGLGLESEAMRLERNRKREAFLESLDTQSAPG
jgi:hypothetical protein